MDYLSREEAPDEETARIEGSGREEKANQPRGIGREGGRADVGVRETVHYLVLRSCTAGLNRQNTRPLNLDQEFIKGTDLHTVVVHY